MLLKPYLLGGKALSDAELEKDKKECRKFGPCGVGEKALYLNSFYIERRFYVPFTAVTRVFKRVAMSKGGFSGKGIFASMAYLVVIYDGGKEKQCNFKHEAQVDEMLEYIGRRHPDIKLVSEAGEKRLAEQQRRREEEEKKRLVPLGEEAEAEVRHLKRAEKYLEARPELAKELSDAARQKRSFLNGKHSYRYVALCFLAFAFVAFLWGLYLLFTGARFAIYFTLIGLAFIFLFSSANVRPTLMMNKKGVLARDEAAKAAMENYLAAKTDFPVPARYAHPFVIQRMIHVVEEGRAKNDKDALKAVKEDLKAINAEIKVDQQEYDEIVAIKALFLNANYE